MSFSVSFGGNKGGSTPAANPFATNSGGSLGGFSGASVSNSFATNSTTTSNTSTANWNSFDIQKQNVNQAGGQSNVLVNPKYSELDKQNRLRLQIDKLYVKCKEPMRNGLDEISKSQGSVPSSLSTQLKQIQLSTLKFKTVLEKLWKETESFREYSKELHRDTQYYGRIGTQQIKIRGSSITSPYSINEELPVQFFVKAINKLEKRFQACFLDTQELSNQFSVETNNLLLGNNDPLEIIKKSSQSNEKNATERIMQIIQNQYLAFIRLASYVSEIHSSVEELKAIFLNIYYRKKGIKNSSEIRGDLNPFQKAERSEEIKQRRMEDLFNQFSKVQNHQSSNSVPKDNKTGASTTGATGGFGATTGTTGGFGATTGTTGGFGATTGATDGFGATTGATGGFGATTGATGGFGATTTGATGGFGATTGFQSQTIAGLDLSMSKPK